MITHIFVKFKVVYSRLTQISKEFLPKQPNK